MTYQQWSFNKFCSSKIAWQFQSNVIIDWEKGKFPFELIGNPLLMSNELPS